MIIKYNYWWFALFPKFCEVKYEFFVKKLRNNRFKQPWAHDVIGKRVEIDNDIVQKQDKNHDRRRHDAVYISSLQIQVVVSHLTLVLPRYILLHIFIRGHYDHLWKFFLSTPNSLKWYQRIARTLFYPTIPNKVPTLHVCRSCDVMRS